eukprot:559246-Pleurochrysis_carterae.AAC.1
MVSSSSRETGIGTRQPCRVVYHLVPVSQGRGNVTEGLRHRKIYASLTKCIFHQYTDIRQIVYFVGIALNVTCPGQGEHRGVLLGR